MRGSLSAQSQWRGIFIDSGFSQQGKQFVRGRGRGRQGYALGVDQDTPPERAPFLYLTTTGRVSGQPRTIEIWFVEYTDRYYVVAERREAAQWVQNLQRNPAVRFRVVGRDDEGPTAPAKARIVREPDLVAAVASLMNEKYGWSDGLVVEILPDA